MSYILDALKKSDQERKQGEIPSLQTVHSSQISGQGKHSSRLMQLALFLGFVCLVALVASQWSWTTRSTPQVTSQPALKRQIAPISDQKPQPLPQLPLQETAPHTTEPVQKDAPQITEPEQRDPPPVPQATADTLVVQPEVVIEPAPLLQSKQPSAPSLPKAASEPGSTLPLLTELPVDRQKTIPEIKLAGHVYADDPSRRMIMINNKIVREGEMVGEDLKLVRITWDGVILRHRDTEFQINLK